MNKIITIAFVVLSSLNLLAQREHPARPTETGGPLKFEQAAFDVLNYDITLNVDPKTKSITGTTVMTAKIVIPTNAIVLDLDTPYTISKLTEGGRDAKFTYKDGKIWIWFPMTKQVGESVTTSITYAGTPRVAPNPPWIGGFMWAKTPSGADWVSVALQNDGADLLFPCKDHPSDKPATSMMRITVPDPLIANAPGKLESVKKNSNGTTTYNWRMPIPIANYSLVFNAAPYKLIEDKVKSVTGEMIPIKFYILPENFDKGAKLIAETKKYNAFFEKYLGPYPFRAIKLGIVETPHLGMEHSTNIAYGNKYRFAPDGFDWLMFHEYGHEWWANLVTASDWRDFWIHEGFQSFMDTLYVEETKGKEEYFKAMKARQTVTERNKGFRNMQSVAPREAKIAYQVYMAEPDYLKSDGDIYGKGAYILHTLRYLIGDDVFFRALRRMAYPTKEMERLTDGRQERLVNTDDFLTIAETECKCELDWFFEMYLRQPKLPNLVIETVTSSFTSQPNKLLLSWKTPNNLPFPMPIDVEINGKTQRVEMKDGEATIQYNGAAPTIDPNGWVLKTQ
jgi:aminopeptidase N